MKLREEKTKDYVYTEYPPYNVEVFEDTREKSLNEYKAETANLMAHTKVYEDAKGVVIDECISQEIAFQPTRTVTEGIAGVRAGYHVAVLNFADALMPGGLVLEGAGTQEESICRCTNLYESLTTERCIQGYYKYNIDKADGAYSDRLIYSPDVLVIKDDEHWLLDPPVKFDVITIPFPLVGCAFEEIYKSRIRCILHAAADNDVEYLVLGAIGCGAFGNPVEAVAKAFAEILSERCYVNKIVFAIAPSEGVSKDSTYSIFKESFYKYYKEA